MTRDEAIDRFKLVGQLSGRKRRTMDNYLRALNDFCSYVEEVLKIHDFMDISLFDIQNYLHHLESRNYAVKTYNIYVYALRMFYSGVLDRIVDKYKLPVRHPKSKPKPIFTLEETLTLINQCPDPALKAAIVLASGCGLRVSEIANLTFGDFNKTKQLIKIRDSKGDKTRYVPYTSFTANVLREYCHSVGIRKGDPDQYIFPSNKKAGFPIESSSLTRHFQEYIQTFSFYLEGQSIHSLRHVFATQCALQNVPQPCIAKWMGHTCISTTGNYTHCPENLDIPLPDFLSEAKVKL